MVNNTIKHTIIWISYEKKEYNKPYKKYNKFNVLNRPSKNIGILHGY